LARPSTTKRGLITFGAGPLPGQLRHDVVLEFALEYGAPGADLAAPDAKRDIGSVVAQAAPLCRAVIDRLATPTRLPDDYRRRVGETGIGLIRTSRIAAPAVLMDIAGRDALADFAPFSEGGSSTCGGSDDA